MHGIVHYVRIELSIDNDFTITILQFFYKSEWHQVLLLPNSIKDEFLQSTIDTD